MTHDPRAREVIFQALTDRNTAGRALFANIAAPFADAILTALTAAGLRVVSAEPSDKDVERVARAISGLGEDSPVRSALATQWARAALRAFLGGGDD